MDKLKNFIEINRDAFEDEMLPEGHINRFEQKLSRTASHKYLRYYFFAASIAATIATMLLIRLPLNNEASVSQMRTITQINETQQEIKELHTYYNMQLYNIISQMEELYNSENAQGTKELLMASKEILKDTKVFETTILPQLPASNERILALTQHYDNSLMGLSIMYKQMQSIINNQKHPQL